MFFQDFFPGIVPQYFGNPKQSPLWVWPQLPLEGPPSSPFALQDPSGVDGEGLKRHLVARHTQGPFPTRNATVLESVAFCHCRGFAVSVSRGLFEGGGNLRGGCHTAVKATMFARHGAVTPGPSRECDITFSVNGRPTSAQQLRNSAVAARRAQSVTVPSSR